MFKKITTSISNSSYNINLFGINEQRKLSKISFTAIMVAYFRAKYTDMPFAKKIYEKINELSLILRLTITFLGWLIKFSPSTLERLSSLEGRYLAINNAIKGLSNNFAIIEVAAGLSPRGLEWANKQCLFIETDLPKILENKKTIFSKITKEEHLKQNPNHFFIPLNVIDYQEWEKIGKKYFSNKSSKVVIIHEGLIAYFTKNEQKIFRDNIQKFLSTYSPSGIWMTCDFSLPKKINESWIVKLGKKIIQKNTKRSFYPLGDHQEVTTFLAQGNLKANVLESLKTDTLTCLSKFNLNKQKTQEMAESYKVYCITLKKASTEK